MLRYPLQFVGITQGYKLSHKAIDMGWNSKHGGKNANVYASGKGIVKEVVDNKNNTLIPHQSGNYVTIYYPDENLKVKVCHLLKHSIKVSKNDYVNKDTIIAKMGNSGYCGINKAFHTHVIVYKNEKRVNPIDYLYFDDNFNILAKSNTFKIKKIKDETKDKVYVIINAKNGVWARKGVGFEYKKYVAIPYGTKCELLNYNVKYSSNYFWDKIIYNNQELYIPNNWNIYINEKM